MLYECKRWWMFHRFSVWSEPRPYRDASMPEGVAGELQERTCDRCNVKQLRVVDRLFRGAA